MNFARVFWPLAIAAALAACSGEMGGGQSTLPGAPPSGTNNVQQIAQAAATATPVSASNVATLGDNVAPQELPPIMGWGGTIAFPKPTSAPASPNAKATATPVGAATATSVSVGITAAVVEPTDAPSFGTSAKHRGKRDAGSVDALFFISVLATSDVTLAQYPTIAVDVPREIAAKHRDDIFALALYDSSQNDKAFRLAVAERDMTSPAPGSFAATTPIPTPIPTATLMVGMGGGPGALTPPPIGYGLGSGSSLPPERIAFKPTAATLTLKANRPVVFALYAVPPSPSPSPSPSATARTSPSPRASGIASPTPTVSGTALPSVPASPGAIPVSPAPFVSASPVATKSAEDLR